MFSFRNIQLICSISVLFWFSCKKDPQWDLDKIVPRVETVKVSEVKAKSIFISGEIKHNGGLKIIRSGFCLSQSPDSCSLDFAKVVYFVASGQKVEGIGLMGGRIDGLKENTEYFIKAFATNEIGTAYGSILSFKTKRLALVVTDSATEIKQASATAAGTVVDDFGYPVTERGICFSPDSIPTLEKSSFLVSGKGLGSFTCKLLSLPSQTRMYYRAYANNAGGTAYGEIKTFNTLKIAVPVVVTSDPINITKSEALCGGNVTDDGGATVTARGVCYSTAPNPTVLSSIVISGVGTGAFNSNLNGLPIATTYYVRAYATNAMGVGYGDEKTFTTLPELPSIVTSAYNSLTQTSFTAGGTITNNGGATVTERGICWSLGTSPSVSDNKTTDGAGSGTFSSAVSGLLPNTRYFYRAYAKNAAGTSYGNTLSVLTLPEKPTVKTMPTTDVKRNTFTAGGNVTFDGGTSVTERGICWSLHNNPGITDSKAASGSGTGQFTATATGLVANTQYYFKAYAINSTGTSYGLLDSVKTMPPTVPTLVTVTPNDITAISAKSGGNTIDDGGSSITAKGVCWNRTGNPTLSDSRTSDGAGKSDFASQMTGLTNGVQYYVRAYATNALGTGYGQTFSFVPDLTAPQLSTPSYGATVSKYFYFYWSCVPGATSYELQLSANGLFSGTSRSLPYAPGGLLSLSGYHSGFEPGNCLGGTGCGGFSCAMSDQMEASTTAGSGTYTFYWRVRARIGTLTGLWSGTSTFKFVK
jgi:hypothetical protein